MRELILILSCVVSLFFSACSDSNEIHTKVRDSWYDLEDDASDPVQHYIYGFYQAYGTIIITDPEVRDYQFNFQKKNNIRVVPCEQNQELVKKGLEFAKKVFLEIYPDDFKKQFFPYNVILSDSILFLGMEDQVPSYHAFASSNFVAIAGIREGVDKYTEKQVKEIKGEVNGRFWNDYLASIKGVFVFPEEFYEVSAVWYGKSWMDGETPDDIDCHEMGFVDFDWGNTNYDDDPDWGGWWVQVPDKKIDKSQWMAFMFNSSPEERERLFAKYPLMETKYNIVKEAMKKCGGFDITKLK